MFTDDFNDSVSQMGTAYKKRQPKYLTPPYIYRFNPF